MRPRWRSPPGSMPRSARAGTFRSPSAWARRAFTWKMRAARTCSRCSERDPVGLHLADARIGGLRWRTSRGIRMSDIGVDVCWLPYCSTCARAVAYLQEKGVSIRRYRNLKEEPLSEDEVRALAEKVGSVEKLF